MNTLDIGMLVILAIFAIFGYRRGLVHTIYRFASFFAALFLAIRLHPFVSRVIRESFVYESLRGRIADSPNFEAAFREYAPTPGIGEAVREMYVINALPLPQSFRDLINNNNTPAMREILSVGTLEDFVAGFFANIVINVISLVLVFVLVMLILKIVGTALHIVDKLPVVSSLNRLGGFAVGILIGTGVVWLGLVVIVLFFSTGGSDTIYGLIQGSAVASWLFDNGWLLPRLTAV